MMSSSYAFTFSSDAPEIPEDAGYNIDDLLHQYPPGYDDEDSSESEIEYEDGDSVAEVCITFLQ